MLSTENRLRLQNIANKIANGEEVSLADSILIQKWADRNRSVYEMLRKAKRQIFQGGEPQSSLDQFLSDLNIGDPDPSRHRSGFDDPDDLGDFFSAPYRTRRD